MSTFITLMVSGLGVGALYFLLASGLSLIFGLMRILSFAHGAFLSGCAYAVYEVMHALPTGSTWSLFLAIAAANVVGGALAFLTGLLIIKPLHGMELEQLLSTVGISLAFVALLQGIWGPDERLVQLPVWLTATTGIAGANIPNNRFLAVAVAALIFGAILLFLNKTRHGLVIRAGVEDREMVQALGIDVQRSFMLVFTLGGVAAGMAGGFAAIYYRSVSPTMGDTVLIFSFIVLVIGGLGSIVGAAIAAAGIGLIQSTANYYVYNGIGDLLVVALLAIILILRPQGLIGIKERIA